MSSEEERILYNQESKLFQTNNEFDLGKFNTAFDENKLRQKSITEYNSEIRLKLLEKNDTNNININKMSIIDLSIGIKDSWFYLIDDLLLQKFTINTFTKNNRLFYIGLTFILFSVILLFVNEIDNNKN